jgi:hypothetical protein
MGGVEVIGSLARENVFVVEGIGAGGRPAAAIRYENGMSRGRAPVRVRRPSPGGRRTLSLDVS